MAPAATQGSRGKRVSSNNHKYVAYLKCHQFRPVFFINSSQDIFSFSSMNRTLPLTQIILWKVVFLDFTNCDGVGQVPHQRFRCDVNIVVLYERGADFCQNGFTHRQGGCYHLYDYPSRNRIGNTQTHFGIYLFCLYKTVPLSSYSPGSMKCRILCEECTKSHPFFDIR